MKKGLSTVKGQGFEKLEERQLGNYQKCEYMAEIAVGLL